MNTKLLRVGWLVRWISDQNPVTNIGVVTRIHIKKVLKRKFVDAFEVEWQNNSRETYLQDYACSEFDLYMKLEAKCKQKPPIKSWTLK